MILIYEIILMYGIRLIFSIILIYGIILKTIHVRSQHSLDDICAHFNNHV